MDPSQAENLRALGYLAVDSQSNDSNTIAEVDPKDRIDIANKFHRALINLEEDRYDDAIAEATDAGLGLLVPSSLFSSTASSALLGLNICPTRGRLSGQPEWVPEEKTKATTSSQYADTQNRLPVSPP